MEVFKSLDALPKDKRYEKLKESFENLFKSLEEKKKKRGINTTVEPVK